MLKKVLIISLLITSCGPSEIQFIPEDSSYAEEYEKCLQYEEDFKFLDEKASKSTLAFGLFNDAITSGDEDLILGLVDIFADAVLEFEEIYNQSLLLEPNYKNEKHNEDTVKSFELLSTSSAYLFGFVSTGNMDLYYSYEEVNDELLELAENFSFFNSCDEPIIVKSFLEVLIERLFND